MAGLPVPARRHRDQRAVQERHDLGADDLRVARLPDIRICRRRWRSCRRGWTGWSRLATRCTRGCPPSGHRRFVKTHTPLDGIPLDPRATYIVVARHPLDMAVSLYHQGDNLDRERIRRAHRPAATGRTAVSAAAAARVAARLDRPGRRTRGGDGLAARRDVASLRRVGPPRRAERRARALRRPVRRSRGRDAAARRAARDHGARRALARARRGGHASSTCAAGPTSSPRTRRACSRTPQPSSGAGRPASGRELLTGDELAHYHERTAQLARSDLLTWLHR